MQSKNKNALPSWKRNAISSAIALANTLFVTPASAVPCPNSITTSQQGCDASGVSPIDISSSGSVNASGSNAIYYLGSLDGSLTNNGTISLSGDPNSYLATGILIISDLAGTLTNNGLIEANLNTSPGTYFTGTGISVGNTLSGTLINSGTISATATGGTYANANGVHVNNQGGELNNSGSITAMAHATSTDGYASVNGVSAGNSLSGTLTNSGSISSTATGTGASAVGVLAGNYGWYYGEEGPSFDLNNSGSIAATANATSTYGYATAYGVSAGNGLSGTLTNSGSISATATGTGASAVGVLAGSYGGYYGEEGPSLDLNNSGSIAATANATSTYGYATASGVSAGNGLSGTLTNSGSISATATGTSAYSVGVLAGSYGGYYGEEGPSFDLNNSGSIAATANATSTNGYATASGVSAGNGLSGALTNSGSISATATGDIYANAYGVLAGSYGGYYGEEGPSFDLNNSGSIAATANATSTNGYATASGVSAGNGLSGALTNSGSISATATGDIYANAYGVLAGSYGGYYGEEGLSFDLNNSGSIAATANATSTNGYATASGVSAGNGLSGALTNSGSISATATGDTYANAYGVLAGNYGGYYGEDGSSFDLNNSGSIAAKAHATSIDGFATAYGVISANTLSGPLTNSGIISATATGTNAYATGVLASIYGGYYGQDGHSFDLNNSGIISATATGNQASANGVNVVNLRGTLTNKDTGNINATATGTNAYAIGVDLNNLDGEGELSNSGSIAATANSTSSDGYATANGVSAGNILSGTLTNSGSISATATSDTYANANGINMSMFAIGSGSASTLINSGTISAMATGDTNANAIGVKLNPMTIGGGSVGTLTNIGAISAIATGNNARAAGVAVDGFTFIGNQDNLPDFMLDLNNSGKISGTADNARDGYSIYMDNGSTYQTFIPALQIFPVNVGGTINNLAGGLLSGNIYTGGEVAVNNAGTIAIPAGVQGYINGNYNQSSTGVLSIVATSNSNYGQLDVGGIATLAPSTTINVSALDGTQTLSLNGILANVLSADTLNASTVNVTDNSVLFNFTPNVYTGNAGHIDLKVEKGIPVLQAVLNEGNYPAAGAAATLDNLIYNGGDTKPFGAVVNALGKMTTQQQLSKAVDQTLPALTSGVANMTILTTNAGDSIVGSRQELARGLSAGDGLSPDSHVWLKPFGNWTQQDKRDGVTGYNADNFGIALGGDMDVTSTWNAGAAFIYTHGNVHSNNMVSPQRIDMNTYSAKLYATKNFGESTRLNFQVGGGASTYDSSRNIAFMGTLANAEYDGRQGRAKVELEHDFVVAKKTKLTPYVSLNYVHVHVDGYNEKGANALNLKANGDSQDSLVIGGGVKVAQEVTDKLLLTAKAGGGYDPVISASTLTSSFSGGGAVFSTQGISPAKGVFGGNVSAKYTLSTHSEITAGYDVQARENFIDQAATLNVRIKF